MIHTRVFLNNRIQTVRLPKALAMDYNVREVTVVAVGRTRVIAPIGGHLADYGIWDDVWLLARPTHCLDDVAVDSSFRRQSLCIRGTLSQPIDGLTVAGRRAI